MPTKLEKFYIWSLRSIIFVIPFLPLYVSYSMPFPFITGKNFAFRILVEIAAVLWLGLTVLNKEYRLRNSTMLLLVMAFTFIVGLADLLGVNPYKSLWSGYERMEGYLTILHLGLYFIIVKSILRTGKDWIFFLNIFVLVSVLVNSNVLLQKFGYIGDVDGGFRHGGTIGNPAFLAAYLLLTIFLSMILMVKAKVNWLKSVYSATIGLDLLLIYYSATRGVILAVIVGMISFSLFYVFGKSNHMRERLFKKIAISVLGGIIILSILFFALRDTTLINQNKTLSRIAAISTSDPTVQFRLIAWEIAWEGIKERPILGWGQENFLNVYTKYYNPKLYGLETWGDRAHNIVLDWLINAGFLGLLFYISIYGILFFNLWSAHRSKLISQAETVTIATAIIVYFFQNLFIFDTINTYIIFFTLLAYVDSFSEEDNVRLAAPGRLKIKSLSVIALALIIFSFAAYFINYKPIRESLLVKKISVSFPKYKSFSRALDDFKKALSYKTFGDEVVRFKMALISNEILKLEILNKEGALKFVQATAIEMEKQVAANPDNFKYLILLIELFNDIALHEPSFIKKAEAYIKEGLRLSPGNQQVYFTLADNFVLKKEYENAFLAVKKAVVLEPRNDKSQLKLALAAILTSKGKVLKGVLEDIKKIRAAKDSDIAAGKKSVFTVSELLNLALLSAEIKNFTLALEFYKEIIAISPENAEYHFEIAKIYLALGDKANAVKEAKKAAELDLLKKHKR